MGAVWLKEIRLLNMMHGETPQAVTIVLPIACIRTSLNVSCFFYHILKCPPKLPSEVKYRCIQKILNIFWIITVKREATMIFLGLQRSFVSQLDLPLIPYWDFLGKIKTTQKTIYVCHKVLGCSSAADIWLACVRSLVPSRGKTADNSEYHKEILVRTNKERGTCWGLLLAHQGVESM